MPRGGARRGAGRKPGGANLKTREIADNAAVRGSRLPLQYMLDVMSDPSASQGRRDAMAVAAAVYCHPRLSSIATSNVNTNYNGGDVSITQIFAVPRGAALDVKEGEITIDGDPVTELSSIEPYPGTPGLPAPIDAPAPIERLPIVEMDEPENVTRLDQFKAKRDDT
jgi:hypothetical protein